MVRIKDITDRIDWGTSEICDIKPTNFPKTYKENVFL